MRVQVNGLLPLLKSSVIEYPNGDEVTATFTYERIGKHCSKCLRLDHEVKDCLIAKHQAREALLLTKSINDSVSEGGKRDLRQTSESGEPYHFSAVNEVISRDQNREEYGECQGARRSKDRVNSHYNQDNHQRRTYKEPPRGWQTHHSRSYNTLHEDSHRNRLTRDDARHRLSTQNRDDLLNVSRERRHEHRDEASSTKYAREQPPTGIPRQIQTPPRIASLLRMH